MLRLSLFSRHSPLLYSPQRPPSYFVAPASSRLCLGVRRLDAALSALCRGGACPARPSPITPNPSFRAEQADFLFRVCSCKSVGLRSEESLFCLLPTHSSLATALQTPCPAAAARAALCRCRGGACPARPSRITPNPSFRAEQADFLFRVCSCKSVGLRSEESLFCLLPTHSSLATALQTPCPAAAARAALCRCRGGACPARPSRITPNLSFRAQRGISLVSRHSPLATALSSVAKAALVFRSAGFPPPLECGGWTPLSPRFVGAGLAPPAPRASPQTVIPSAARNPG